MLKINAPKNSSASTQCVSIIKFLKATKSGATNREIGLQLEILDPRKRISEIRAHGHRIDDHWEYWFDEFNNEHRVKRYFYKGRK